MHNQHVVALYQARTVKAMNAHKAAKSALTKNVHRKMALIQSVKWGAEIDAATAIHPDRLRIIMGEGK